MNNIPKIKDSHKNTAYAPITKFIIPESNSLKLTRTRIYDRLNESTRRKLTIVTAPAGFGKSTAISNWLLQKDLVKNAAWITLDSNDKEAESFWHYVICAVNLNRDIVSNEKIQYLSAEVIINLLINHFSVDEADYYIIFDDFHNISCSEIYKSLEYFLTYLPRNLHCIIISRSVPSLSVSRMKIDEEISIFDSQDLKFTTKEISAFLDGIMDLNLSEDQIKSLETKAEGWIAIIKAAALSLKNCSDRNAFISGFNGSNNRNMFQYITEEVISNQKPEIIEFLLKTSILRDLNESICNALTGFENSREIIKKLETSNLFITGFAGDKVNYRYHHLLSEVLLKLLHIQYPSQVRDLYLSASRWYEERGYYQDAFENSMQSKNPHNTLRLLEKYFSSNNSYTLRNRRVCEYFETIPHELYNSKPEMCIHYALALAIAGRLSMNEKELLDKGIDLDSKIFEPFMGQVSQVRAYEALKGEKMTDIINYSKLSLQQLSEHDISNVTPCLVLGYIYRSIGDMDKAEFYFKKAFFINSKMKNTCPDKVSESLILSNFYLTSVRYFKGESNDFIEPVNQLLAENITHKNCMYFCLATTYYDCGDFQKALPNVIKGLELCNTYDDIFYERIKGLVLLARIRYYTGKLDQVVSIMNEIDKFVRRDSGNMFVCLELPKIIGLLASSGLMERAQAYIAKFGDTNCKEAEFVLCEAQAELFLVRGNYREAVDKLEYIIKNMHLEIYPKKKIELFVLAAAIYKAVGNESKALEVLCNALETKCVERYTRVFVERGNSINSLLRKLISKVKKGDGASWLTFADKLLKRAEGGRAGLDTKQFREPGQLSQRELEVLKLLAKGSSYDEIGNELFISLSTVKKHTGNIYVKLQAKNRMDAVNIANSKRLIH